MNNATIILLESVKLLEEGKLEGTGEVVVIEDAEGNKKEYPVPEEIHTFQHWKSLGFSVKKGEKAIAQFPIWKYTKKKKPDDMTEEEAAENGYCFLKNSSFFKASQVEKIEGVV